MSLRRSRLLKRAKKSNLGVVRQIAIEFCCESFETYAKMTFKLTAKLFYAQFSQVLKYHLHKFYLLTNN